MSLTILRVEKGLDYSQILGEENEMQIGFDSSPSAMHQQTNASNISQVHESNESLNRNGSQGTVNLKRQPNVRINAVLSL